MRSVPTLVSVAASIVLTACAGGDTRTAVAPAASPPSIDVVRVVRQPLDVTLSMPGQLDPYEAVAVYPKVTAFVKSIRVDRGSHVRGGELLAQLDAPELVSQRGEAQSKLQGAQAQLAAARAKTDADASTFDKLKAASATPGVVAGNDLVVAQKALEADQSQTTAAQQSVEAARQALQAVTQMEAYLHVTAPFAGVITERNVHPGALVGPGSSPDAATPMLRVVQTDRLRLVVPVPEAYASAMPEGATVAFTVPAFPGRDFSGALARVAHAVDVKTRTMAVELDVMNRDGSLAPGAYCTVRWPVRRSEPSLLVPSGSIATTTDRTFVIRIRNGRTEWVNVRTGLVAGENTEVFGDLQPGDTIAARGTDELRSGVDVRVKETAKAAATPQTPPQGAPPKSLEMGGAKSVTRFFVTSHGVGRGGDLGGLAGADAHCQALAKAEGAGDHTWRAYLSTSAQATAPPVNARDRIGHGPWYNALGDRVAGDLAELHHGHALTSDNALTERGDDIPAAKSSILTGSRADGTAFAGADDRTCGNWTSNRARHAQLGTLDARDRGAHWNSARASRGCGPADLRAGGSAGLFYCFAID